MARDAKELTRGVGHGVGLRRRDPPAFGTSSPESDSELDSDSESKISLGTGEGASEGDKWRRCSSSSNSEGT